MEPDCRDCPVKQSDDERMGDELEAIHTQLVTQAASSGELKGLIQAFREEVVRRFEKLNGRVGEGEKNHEDLCKEVTELKENLAIMRERKAANSQWIKELRPVIWVLVTFFVLLILKNADLLNKSIFGHSEDPKIEVKK